MEFRQDINGLRAFAVLAVMLYHFGIPGFAGGFGGVDVFFVISGYLMTAIILGGLAKGSFSLIGFYASRARRLAPALIALCAALLLAGWFWLPPSDYKMLGRHAATALLFVSNFIFKNEDGYFDVFSQDKWLLHTWSLSVEWQFYLLYPLVLLALWRTARGGGATEVRLKRWLLAFTVGGFLFCTLYTPVDPAFSFYLLPTRLWEMSAGGLVFLLARQGLPLSGTRLFYAGIACIAASIVLFDANTPWPGSAALLPVVGTALVILGSRTEHPLLGNIVAQKLGIWSYSIYLWHWPVVVALHQFGLDDDRSMDAAGIGLSVLLGALSYHIVETPLRRRPSGTWRPLGAAVLATLFVAVAGSALWVDRQDGLASRAAPAVRTIESEVAASRATRPKPCKDDPFIFDTAPCHVSPQNPDFIVWGDSHASVLFDSIEKAAGTLQGYSYQATCPPVPDSYLTSKKFSYECPAFTDKVFDRIEDMPRDVPVIVVFRMSIYTKGYNERPDKPVGLQFNNLTEAEEDTPSAELFTQRLNDSLCELAEDGRPVFVMKPVPEIGVDVPHEMTRDIMFKGAPEDITLPLTDYQTRHAPLITTLQDIQKKCGIRLLDPVDYLCRDGKCLGTENGLPLYTDDNHLARLGSDKLIAMFKTVFAGAK